MPYGAPDGARDTKELRAAAVRSVYPHAVCVKGGPRHYRGVDGTMKLGAWYYIYESPAHAGGEWKLGWGGNERGAWGHAWRPGMKVPTPPRKRNRL